MLSPVCYWHSLFGFTLFLWRLLLLFASLHYLLMLVSRWLFLLLPLSIYYQTEHHTSVCSSSFATLAQQHLFRLLAQHLFLSIGCVCFFHFSSEFNYFQTERELLRAGSWPAGYLQMLANAGELHFSSPFSLCQAAQNCPVVLQHYNQLLLLFQTQTLNFCHSTFDEN